MAGRAESPRSGTARAVAWLAACASLIGGISVIGWMLDVDGLKSVVPGFHFVRPNAAVSFVLLGTAGMLLLAGGARSHRRRVAGHAGASLAIGLATLTLIEHLGPTGLDLDIRWLSVTGLSAEAAAMARPPAVSAGLLLLLAMCIVLRSLDRMHRASEVTAAATALLALVAVTGDVFQLASLGPATAARPPLASMMAVVALGAAVLAARPERGWAATLVSPDLGGVLARRLLPAAIVVPYALGWLRLVGEEAGYYGTTAGTMGFVVATILILSVLTMHLAAAVDHAHRLRSQSAETLHAHERRFRALIENGRDAITLTGPDGTVGYASPTAHRMFDHGREDLIGSRIAGLVHPDDREEFLAREREVFATPGAVVCGDSRFRRGDGTWRWVEATRTNHLADPMVAAIVGNYRDIHDRRLAEDALRASEGRQHFLADLAGDVQRLTEPSEVMAVVARRLGEQLQANRCAYAEVEDEAVFVVTGDYTDGVPSIVGRWPIAAFGADCLRSLLANEPFVVDDAEADTRLGPADLPAYRAAAIRSAICVPLHKAGRLTAAMAVHQQVARTWTRDEVALVRLVIDRCWEPLERARVLRTLMESEARYRALFESIDEGFCVIDVLFDPDDRPFDYRFVEVNPAFERQTGLKDVVGRTVREFAPAHESHWFEAYGRVARTGEPLRFENRTQAREDRWYDVYAFKVGRAEERKVALLFTDVTARKGSEQRLRASEARLRQALAAARMVAWERDLATGVVTLSESAEDVLGVPPGTTTLAADDMTALVEPEDRARRHAAISRAIERRGSFSVRYRLARPRDGAVVWVEAWGHALCDQSEDVSRLIGMLMDVTEKRRAEAARLHFQALFEAAPGMYLVLAPTFVIVAASDAYLRATKTVRELIVGRNLFEVFPDDPADPVADGTGNLRDSLDRVRTTRRADVMAVQRYPIPRPADEGGGFEERYWSPLNSPVFGPDGELAYIVHRVEDVTEYVRERQRRGGDALSELESRAKHMEAEVFLRGRELERANRALRESEELFRGAFEDTGVATAVVDLTDRFLRTNAAFDGLFGYAVAQMTGLTMADVMHPDDAAGADARRQALLAGAAKHFQGESRYRHSGGREFWGLTNVCLVRDADGVPVRYVVQVQNVTARRRAETELRQSESRYRELFERNPHPMWVFDVETFHFLAVNDAAVARYGYSRDEFLCMTLRDIRPHEDVMPLEDHLQADLTGPVEHGVWRHRWKDGTVRQVEITSHDLVWQGRDARLVLANDVTERRQLEEGLRRSRAELEERVRERTAELKEANKELEAFSYSVSHDLRAPLRSINGFARILLEKHAPHLPVDARAHLQEVIDSAREMGQLVDDLLAFSRLGRKDVRVMPVDCAQLARECVDDLRDERAGRTIELTIHDLPPCHGDPALLRQVWFNLLSNALKYTRRSAPARIEVGFTTDGAGDGEVTYFVRDNGVGFDMRYAQKLFGVFQRLHRSDEYEGTGVGLAIVQRIVHRHGGRVRADARPDEGATFYITLQRADNDNKPH